MNKPILTTTLMLIVLLCFGQGLMALNANLKDFSVVSEAAGSMEIKYKLPAFSIENTLREGKSFQKIKMEGTNYLSEPGYPELPLMSTMVIIPDHGSVSVELISSQSRVLDNFTPIPLQPDEEDKHGFVMNEACYKGNVPFVQDLLSNSEAQVMRDFRLITIQVQPFIWDVASQRVTIHEELRIRVRFSEQPGINELSGTKAISPAFDKIYSSLILNYADYRNGLFAQVPSRIVMVYGENTDPAFISALNDFAFWKKQKGAEVQLLSTAETGSSNTSIKAFLQNLYNDITTRPDYIVLIGDVSGSFAVPAWSSSGFGDYPYQMLAGDDLLGDVFLGRISAENISQLSVIFAKIYAYEKNINVQNAEWLNRMLLTADTLYSGVSVVNVSNYIREISLLENPDYSYTMLCQDAPSPTAMNAALNQGVGFFNYRGYAGMSGWSVSDTNLYNVNKLCHAVILTCNTGNYDATGISELFIRIGTSAAPKGAVTAIGMWSAGTATMPNNALCGGIFAGIFNEGMRTMGEALLHSKLNFSRLYAISNPNMCTSFNQWCNLMGDPTMEVFTGIPQTFANNVPNAVPSGTSSMELIVQDGDANPVESACVTVTWIQGNNREILSRAYSDATGYVYLPLSAEVTSGNIIITISKHDFKPLQSSVPVEAGTLLAGIPIINDDNAGASSGNGNGIANAGETVEISFALRNTSDSVINSLTGSVSCSSPFVTITDSLLSYPSISSGGIATNSPAIVAQIAPNTPNNTMLRFSLSLSDQAQGEYQIVSYFSITDAELRLDSFEVLDNGNSVLDPGETANLKISITNIGTTLVEDMMGELFTGNDLLIIVDSLSTFGSLGINQQATNTGDYFSVQARTILVPGMIIPLRIKLFNAAGFTQWLEFSLSIGSVTVTDPLGPDMHGYLIYDDGDTAYAEHPVYNWLGIAPAEGGSGSALNINDPEAPGEGDDIGSASVDTVTLPFDFVFYGKSYREITVSSNGFIVMGVTDNPEFRNYRLPGPMGPAPMIAAFWDDLATGPESGVYTYYNEAEHSFIIEWYQMQNGFQNYYAETFQIILYDPIFHPGTLGDGPIKIQYHTFNNVDSGASNQNHGNFCSIGIENEDQLDGLEYSFMNTYPAAASPLGNGRALYITNIPVYYDSPWLITVDTIINDQNNSIAEPGETIELGVILENLGNHPANGITATISSLDPYVTINNSQSLYHPINGHGQGVNVDAFGISVAPNCPDDYRIMFTMQISTSTNSWTRSFQVTVEKPELAYHSFYLNDTGGNNNGFADPGETMLLIVNVINPSDLNVTQLLGQLSTTSPYLTISNASLVNPDLEPGAISQFAFNITLEPSTPLNSTLPLSFSLSAQNAETITHQFSMGCGNMGMNNNFEENNGGFTAQNGWQWGTSDYTQAHSGSRIWATGLSGQYPNGANFFLVSPPVSVGTDAELSFWHQLYCQNNFDGGNVSVSLNNGASWIVISPTSGGSYINSVYSMNEPGFSGMVVNWTKVTFNLAPYANHNILIRWHFTSDGSVTGFGWMLDDVQVSGYAVRTGVISGELSLSDAGNPAAALVSTMLSEKLIATHPNAQGEYALYLPYGSYSLQASKPYYVGSSSPLFIVTPDALDYVHDFSLVHLMPVTDFSLSYDTNNATLSLAWNAPGSSDNPVLSYKVYRKVGPGIFAEIAEVTESSFSEILSLIGHYYYQVRPVYSLGEGEPSDTLELVISPPSGQNDNSPELVSGLFQNFPNPFNPSTSISLNLAKAGVMKLDIYNLKGQLVRTLARGNSRAGKQSYHWDGKDDNNRPVASGVYLYRLETKDFSQTRKMLLLK